MYNKFKSIILLLAAMTVGMVARGYNGPAIHPAEAANGDEAAAWTSARPGVALLELESRTPSAALNGLVQPDGIINFQPQLLTGIKGAMTDMPLLTHLPAAKIPGGSNLGGVVGYNLVDLVTGVYRLPISTGMNVDLLRQISGIASTIHGGAASDDYFVMSYYGMTIQNGVNQCLMAIFDRHDWSLLAEVGDYGEFERVCTDLTYDPTTERFYGCFLSHDQSRWVLGYLQLNSMSPVSTLAKIIEVGTLEVSLGGIAADNDGVLWGIRNDTGELVKISKKNGGMTLVAPTGFVPGYNGSLVIDNVNSRLYWAATFANPASSSGLGSAILTVDKATGALSSVYNFPDVAQTTSLFVEFTAASGTPGQVSNLKAVFDGESLIGDLMFDAPATLTDGNVVTGPVSYTLKAVKDNGYCAIDTVMSCNYGDKGVTVPVKVKTPGNYTFTLQPVNEAGPGYPSAVTIYLGPDLPREVENLELARSGNTVQVTWDNNPATQHGGYFDPAKVKYQVTLSQADANGNVISYDPREVTSGTASWTVSPSDDGLTGFMASVTPVFDLNEGEPTTTGWVWDGSLKVPFVQTMRGSLDAWMPFNAGKGASWQRYSYADKGSGWAIPYNWGSTNDAWLFSPSIYLEKGRFYTFSFKTWSSVVNQSLAVWLGRGAEVDSMLTKLEDIVVTGYGSPSKPQVVTFSFMCSDTGEYYLGLHNYTKSDTYTNMPYMWVNDMACEVAPLTAPEAPGLVVDYDRNGALSATVRISVPDKKLDGGNLEKVDSVTLKVGGSVVNRWAAPAPGQELTYDFTPAKAGAYIFVAEAMVAGVSGATAISNTYIGMMKTLDPEWVNVEEQEALPGTVDVTWAPVTKAINGQEIAPEAVKYDVMNILTNSYIDRDVTEQPFVWTACDPERQTAICVSVNAKTSAGISSLYGTYANQSIMHVGKPYELPVRESFQEGLAHYSWTIVNRSSSSDGIQAMHTGSGLGDVDASGDGYCLHAFVPYGGTSASVYSGRINIPAESKNPVIGFAVYRRDYGDGKSNDNSVQVSIMGKKQSGRLAPIREGDQNFGWRYYYYDMSMFKGDVVNLFFTFNTVSYTSHYIDDIQLYDAMPNDLGIEKLSAPVQVRPGNKFQIPVSIVNRGTSRVKKGAAKVELLREGNSVGVVELPVMSGFQTATANFTDELNNSFDSEVKYEARIISDIDPDKSNNAATATVSLLLPELPEPTALDGQRDDSGYAALSWAAPDLSPRMVDYSLDFEWSRQPSMSDLGGFTSIDVDGNEVDAEVLGVSGRLGFFSFPHTSMSRSGKWMLVSATNVDGAPKEDWLVSPRLSGNAQTISFYVRTNWNAYERFTVLTSTTGSDRDDFTTTALDMTTKNNDWNHVEVEVPEGTTYFAIVSKAEDTTGLIYLMLDDFTFEGADANAGLILEGYNTYRDNILVEPVGIVNSWSDLTGDSGPHFYRVTASYGAAGESAPSNELFLFTRGAAVEGISSFTGRVYATAGRIVVEGAEGSSVTVTTPSGIVIRQCGDASAIETVSVAPGVYIVSIDRASVKIVVR